MTFSMPSLALILGSFTVRMESLLLFKKKTVLPSSLLAWSNSFVCLYTSSYTSCWNFVLSLSLSLSHVVPTLFVHLLSCFLNKIFLMPFLLIPSSSSYPFFFFIHISYPISTLLLIEYFLPSNIQFFLSLFYLSFMLLLSLPSLSSSILCHFHSPSSFFWYLHALTEFLLTNVWLGVLDWSSTNLLMRVAADVALLEMATTKRAK